MLKLTNLKYVTEALIIIGALLIWTSIVIYHADFIWPFNIPGEENRADVPLSYLSMVMRVAPLYGTNKILFWTGVCVAVFGSMIGFLFVKCDKKYVHAWIGLASGFAFAITDWYLLGEESSSAWIRLDEQEPIKVNNENYFDLEKADINAPIVSYFALMVLSSVVIARNLFVLPADEYFGVADEVQEVVEEVRPDHENKKPQENVHESMNAVTVNPNASQIFQTTTIEDAEANVILVRRKQLIKSSVSSSIWIVKILLMVSIFFFQIYYPVMLLGGDIVGQVCLAMVPAFFIAAYGIGRALSMMNKRLKYVGELETDPLLLVNEKLASM